MIKIEKTEVMGFEQAIRGMRNPMNSWDKSDRKWWQPSHEGMNHEAVYDGPLRFVVEPNDHELMMKLARGGSVHGKFRRMITVYLDITAPLYWWKEFDTYKIGTVANSCSTMHKIHAKEFTLEDFSCEHLSCWGAPPRLIYTETLMDEKVSDFLYDYMGCLMATIVALNSAREQFLKTQDKQYWWQMIQLLPSSYNQKRTIMLNYEVLAGIYEYRLDHKLDEWRAFCKWIEELPYSEIITCNKTAL